MPSPTLSGHFEPSVVAGVKVMAFVPALLPPPLEVDAPLRRLLDQTALALGALEGAANALPEPAWLLHSYVRREAVLTSQIEGTRSSFAELLAFEAESQLEGGSVEDLRETARAAAAMEKGLRRLKDLPLSVRLLKEMHQTLMGSGAQGALATAGELRRSQNWIGGASPDKAVHVPPPAHRVVECLSAWERYLHRDEAQGLVVKAALAHAQFESIHPFLDGNGRLGRQVVTLLLMQEGALSGPWLWLSFSLKKRRQEYYRLLNGTRHLAGWLPWVRFFAECLLESAIDAREKAQALDALARRDHAKVVDHGRRQMACLLLHESFCRRPVLGVQQACALTGLVPNAVANGLKVLVELGLVRELSGRKRGRVYGYTAMLKLLDAVALNET